jgi:hypothetical protein
LRPPQASLGRALAWLLATSLTAGLAACGGGDSDEVTPSGENELGSIAALAQCKDWNSRDEDERLETIELIRGQINLEDAPVESPALTDEQAYEVFENGCKPAYADTVRLYILYSRAAAFSSVFER